MTPKWGIGWNDLVVGNTYNLVLHVASVDVVNGRILGAEFPSGMVVRIVGNVSWDPQCYSITVMGGKYVGLHGLHQFQLQDRSKVLGHVTPTRESLVTVIDACSGIGISSMGLDAAGFRIKVANDHCEKLLTAYQEMHPDIPTVLGEIGTDHTICALYAAVPNAGTLAAGFSCQPFSSGGRCLGGLDPRSSSLPGVLRTAFFLRVPIVLLECVVNASSNRFVRCQLESFAAQCGYLIGEVVLRLEDVWVSKRERWWVTLLVKTLGPLKLHGFVSGPFPAVVKDVMPRTMSMPDEELAQLLVNVDEHRRLLRFCDPSTMWLPRISKCPTALHSWGSQVLPCPCGCRPHGFSDEVLASRGVYGVFLPMDQMTLVDDQEHRMIRHLHPSELAILTGTPIPVRWPKSLKLTLCGLGQQASPLQAVWVAGQVQKHLDLVFGHARPHDFESSFWDLMSLVVDQCKALFADSSAASSDSEPPVPVVECALTGLGLPEWISKQHVGGDLSFTLHFCDTQHQEVIALSHRLVTVGNLRSAEVHINPIVEQWDFVDCATGRLLPNDCLVNGMSILIRAADLCPMVPGVIPCDVAMQPLPDELPGGEVEGAVMDCKGDDLSPTVPFKIDSPESSGSVPLADPLLGLTPAQLLEVLVPQIGSVEVLHALVGQQISSVIRRQLIDRQETLWADDEVRWHLENIVGQAGSSRWVVLDPLLATAAVHKRLSSVIVPWYQQLGFEPAGIVTCIVFEGHWIPLTWTWSGGLLVCRSWDVQRKSPLHLTSLHEALSLAVGTRSWTTTVVTRMFSVEAMCGVCAVRYVDSIVRGRMLPTSRSEVEQLHEKGRSLFLDSLHMDFVSRPWIWGAGLDPHAHRRLSELFAQHGVPSDMIDTRISLLCQSLGVGAVQRVAISTSPWRGLKSLANQQKPPFQLVLPSELADAVQAKAKSGGQAKQKKGSGKGQPSMPARLDPSKLKVEPGYFSKADGGSLRLISCSQIGPFAEGIALASVDMVETFLSAGKVVSSFALAVVVINSSPDDFHTSLSWSQMRVPLRCLANDDPMLVSACVVQLGTVPVLPPQNATLSFSAEQAACVKVSVYRDTISCSWADFLSGPVRYILDRLPMLQVCDSKKDECTCSKWHISADSLLKDPVLDVWRRQWLSTSFKACSSDSASIFLVNLRYAQVVEEEVLRVSGSHGMFLEPRSLDGRSPIMDWQVLWLQRMSLKEVQHLRQCDEMIVGLARMGSRLGVRTKAAQAVEVGAKIKPDMVVLASGSRMDFEMGPLPFGLDRSAVHKICQQLHWQARAVNPSRTLDGQAGTMWHVQSACEPPSMVLSTKSGDVVITKMNRRERGGGEKLPIAIGSNQTVGLCAFGGEQSGEDPWANYRDPWSSSLKKNVPVPSESEPPASFRKVEERIEKAVLAKIPQSIPMEVDGLDVKLDEHEAQHRQHDSRFQSVEAHIQQLVQHQQSLEAKLDATTKKVDVQVNQLQCQVTAQFEAQSNRMEDMFQKQMDQISTLLSKRARTE